MFSLGKNSRSRTLTLPLLKVCEFKQNFKLYLVAAEPEWHKKECLAPVEEQTPCLDVSAVVVVVVVVVEEEAGGGGGGGGGSSSGSTSGGGSGR